MKKKMLLAVSGGPDSMFLLDWYKKKNIVVAHVNYHKREDSDNDERIVREFCNKHSIPLEVLNVKDQPEGNFQEWARNIRYNFFKEVYNKYSCDVLLTAHHKDDFLETAWMQMKSGRTPRQFGIAQKQKLFDMNIQRPFIDLYWKDEIQKELESKNIAFATDYTNELPMYERNKVRLELKQLSLKEKKDRYQWFEMSNKILNKKNKKVEQVFTKWENTGFELGFFRELEKYKEEVIFMFIHSCFDDNKVSSAKLEGIVQFINGKEGSKKYYVSEKEWLKKENGKLVTGREE